MLNCSACLLCRKARESPQMRPTPAAGPSQKSPKKCLKFGPGKSHLFRPKMDSTWTPKGTQNRLKSAKMLPRTPPEWVWRPGLEKVASRTLPETPLCAENIAPAMLFTLPRGCPWVRFGLHFNPISEAFWSPLATKSRPGGEQEIFLKSLKKRYRKRCPKVFKITTKTA